jgi:hypothetical protein
MREAQPAKVSKSRHPTLCPKEPSKSSRLEGIWQGKMHLGRSTQIMILAIEPNLKV